MTNFQRVGLAPSARTALQNDPYFREEILGFVTTPLIGPQSGDSSNYPRTTKNIYLMSKFRQPLSFQFLPTGLGSNWHQKFTNIFASLDNTRTSPPKPCTQSPTAYSPQFIPLSSSTPFAFLNPIQPTGFFPNAKALDVRHSVFNNIHGDQMNTIHGEYALHVLVTH